MKKVFTHIASKIVPFALKPKAESLSVSMGPKDQTEHTKTSDILTRLQEEGKIGKTRLDGLDEIGSVFVSAPVVKNGAVTEKDLEDLRKSGAQAHINRVPKW